jgi:5-methylcytosine-specific restriction protein A
MRLPSTSTTDEGFSSPGADDARPALVAAASSFAIGVAEHAGVAPDGDLIASLDAIAHARRSLDAAALVLVAALDDRSVGSGRENLAHRLGDRTPVEVAARALGLDGGAATDLALVGGAVTARRSLIGETLPARMPVLAEAIAAGTISLTCAATLVRTIDTVSSAIGVLERDDLTRNLIAAAAELTPREFRRLCREIPSIVMPDDEESREALLRTGTSLKVTTKRNGQLEFVLIADPESGGLLLTALDARTAPTREPVFRSVDPDAAAEGAADRETDAETDAMTGVGGIDADPETDAALADRRPLHERRANALIDIVRESIGRDAGDVGGVAVTMLVTVPLEVLQSGIGAATIAGVDEPICASTARRLAADAEIIPVVLGGDGEILDLGRSQRLFSRAQRRALAVRDGGCIWPGCQAPPGWCEVAHLRSWALGGPTDLVNGALLCRFHHRRFDRDGWRLDHRMGVDGILERWLVPPPWIDASMRPRRVRPAKRVTSDLRRRFARVHASAA